MPPWIGLCLDTMRRNIPGVEILTRQQWRDMFDFRDVSGTCLANQTPNLRSDFIRAWLLKTYGGIWIDADCIVFRDVRPIFGHLDAADLVAYRVGHPSPQLCSALMAAKAGTPIISDYYRACCRRLRRCGRLPRLALGPKLLRRTIEGRTDRVHFLPSELVHPVHWRRAWRLRQPGQIDIPGDAYTCMLTHRALGPMRHWPSERIRESETAVGDAFRRALDSPRQ